MAHRGRQPVVLTSYSAQCSLDMYLHEVRSIRESRMFHTTDDDQLELEEDPNALWLRQAGFETIVTQLESGESMEDSNELDSRTAALPKAHARAVKQRMNTLRSTIRSRQQNGKSQQPKSDIRGVFKDSGSPSTATKGSAQPKPDVKTVSSSSGHGSPQLDRKHNAGRARPMDRSRSTDELLDRHRQVDPGTRESIQEGDKSTDSRKENPRRHAQEESDLRTAHKGRERDAEQGSQVDFSIGKMKRATPTTSPRNSPSPRRRVSPMRSSPQPQVEQLTVSRLLHLRPGHSRSTPLISVQNDSPREEDIKLHFGSPAHPGLTSSYSAVNGTPNSLPNFTIMADVLGITHIDDLSPMDLVKVRSLAMLELTVTFDDHNIPLRPRRPAKVKNIPEERLFGVPLTTLLQADQKRYSSAQIPLFFDEMVTFLENYGITEEGVLRIPGSSTRVNALMQEAEAAFYGGGFSFEGRKVSDVASLLKQFLRDLPVPLLTRQYLTTFASIADLDELKEQVRTLNLLVLLLPTLHQKVLKRLIVFCERIYKNSETNKMDLLNIAMVIAPNLFVSLPSRHSLDDVVMAAKTSHVVRLLIKYHRLLWTIPGEMLRQVRYLYEAEVHSSKRLNHPKLQKVLREMQQRHDQQAKRSQESEHSRIIRIKAPLFTRVCMAVNISDGVTAGEIISKLQKRSKINKETVRKRFSDASYTNDSEGSSEGSIDAGEQFLFEVGGNIGERCLSQDTDMYALYSVNPNAQWIIKPRDCPDLN